MRAPQSRPRFGAVRRPLTRGAGRPCGGARKSVSFLPAPSPRGLGAIGGASRGDGSSDSSVSDGGAAEEEASRGLGAIVAACVAAADLRHGPDPARAAGLWAGRLPGDAPGARALGAAGGPLLSEVLLRAARYALKFALLDAKAGPPPRVLGAIASSARVLPPVPPRARAALPPHGAERGGRGGRRRAQARARRKGTTCWTSCSSETGLQPKTC